MGDYQLELGQAVFGQQSHQFDVPEIMDAAMQFMRYELSRIRWNIRQSEATDPFGNSGPSGDYESDVVSIRAYSWGDDDQPWNFKCGGVEVSWYKYMGRGMSSNVEITPNMASEILVKCLKHFESLDDRNY